MIETIDSVFRQTLIFYIAEIGIIGAVIMGCIRYVVHDKPNSETIGVVTCLLCVALCLLLTKSVIPFSLDYFCNDICKAHGQYENRVGGDSTSGSSGLGFYDVSITTCSERITLTTAPLSQSIFPKGEYQVDAYYTRRAKILLYIEILEDGV